MWAVLLGIDFLCPLFFFSLGLSLQGIKRRLLIRESLFVFCLVLLFAPLIALFGSVTALALLTSAVLLTQFVLVFQGGKRKVKQ